MSFDEAMHTLENLADGYSQSGQMAPPEWVATARIALEAIKRVRALEAQLASDEPALEEMD